MAAIVRSPAVPYVRRDALSSGVAVAFAMNMSTCVASLQIKVRFFFFKQKTAYELRHKTDAEYHLLQFHATREVLETLQRTLRISDGVVRFRIIKLAPGTPAPPANRPEPRPTG